MAVPRCLRSRFVLVPLVIAIAVAGWNVYVARHDHGHVAGRVEDQSGRPVAGASVVLFERAFTNEVPRAHTRTDAQGRFRFDGNRAYVIELQAHAPDGAISSRLAVHLWFRAQDRALRKPLIVSARAAG
jgi:protocatechuate 3,4-dioxygenase beta subunit